MDYVGPGTIWESWTDTTNSHNHPALAADVGVFLYTLAGVEPSRWGHGESRRVTFSLDALTAKTVGAAYVHVASEGGRASFSWAFDDDAFELNATIPHGDQGTVELLAPTSNGGVSNRDGAECHVLTSRRTPVWSSTGDVENASEATLGQHGIHEVEMGARKLIVVVGSGRHTLALQHC